MINFDVIVKENIKEDNPNWPKIPDHQCRILIIGGSGSGKTSSLVNLINQQPEILIKFYLYAYDAHEAKHLFLINTQESTGVKHFNDIEEYNQIKNKILIVTDDMIVDMLKNKKLIQ